MANINFAYLPGDGIGPEVGEAAMTVLNAMANKFDHTLEPEFRLVGGAAIDELGEPLPAETPMMSAVIPKPKCAALLSKPLNSRRADVKK